MAVDPDSVFNNAMCFVVADRHMRFMIDPVRDPRKTVASAAPLLMMGALTVELLLKTFHALDHGAVPHSHDLEGLFRNLPMESRIAINKHYKNGKAAEQRRVFFATIEKNVGKPVPTDLRVLLASASNAFERYRYSFEEMPDGNPDYLLSDFPQVLVDVLVERVPKWRDWAPTMPTGMADAMGIKFVKIAD